MFLALLQTHLPKKSQHNLAAVPSSSGPSILDNANFSFKETSVKRLLANEVYKLVNENCDSASPLLSLVIMAKVLNSLHLSFLLCEVRMLVALPQGSAEY